jgi:branched-chain amino acid transport system ATP-binding protein
LGSRQSKGLHCRNPFDWHSEGNTMDSKNIVLNVNGIEVIYNHVILVLKGVSLQVPEGSIVAILGGNGAGKTTTLRAISNLLKGERGEVTKGSIELRGERIENLSPADLVKRGVVQVMEGRHCFAHLTIEENLLTGSYTRTEQGRDRRQPGEGLQLLPAPENAPHLAGGLHLGRRAADVRHWPRPHDQPQHGAARRALHGPGAADRGRGVQHRQGPEHQGEGHLPAGRAEHQHGAEVRRLRLHHGKRPHGDGRPSASDLASNEDVKEFYLGVGGGERKSFKDVKSYKRRKRWLA